MAGSVIVILPLLGLQFRGGLVVFGLAAVELRVERFGFGYPVAESFIIAAILRKILSRADEASDALLEYGTIEPEQAAAITETREKYAAREEAAAAQAEEVAPAQSGTASSTEPAKRFILCPKCGERIWL